jgi:hypothetical protein
MPRVSGAASRRGGRTERELTMSDLPQFYDDLDFDHLGDEDEDEQEDEG